jgi:hypothetical protein
MVLLLFLITGIVSFLHVPLFIGKVDPRVVLQELDRIVYLFPASVLLDSGNEVIDPLEQFSMLAVDCRNADRQLFRPFHTTLFLSSLRNRPFIKLYYKQR